jgi:hypothetical protein
VIGANIADFNFGQRAAIPAITNVIHGLRKYFAKLPTTCPIALQQMKRHTLRRLWAHPRQTAQALYQVFQQTLILHT